MVVGFLVVRLLPPIALVIPFYLLASALGLLDTALVLVLVNATLTFPLVVVLMRQAFADLPPELEEAAGIDGAGPWRILVGIVLPLAAPAMVATALIVFAFVWNDFLFASSLSTLARHHAAGTVRRRLGRWRAPECRGHADLHERAAGRRLLAQRWLVSSLTLGAVKG